MSEFNYDEWANATKRIPKERISDALNAVVARKKAIDMEPELFAQRNETATIFHASQGHADGVPGWVKPIADFAAYPAGFEVTHDGKSWVNTSQDIVTGEPGVDTAWQEAVQEEVATDE